MQWPQTILRVFLGCFLFTTEFSAAECIPFHEAGTHVGETRCVTGKVFRIQQGNGGVHYLDFCEDYRVCPFTVVIFPRDLRQVGDVRQLQGKVVEIHGAVKLYDGRAEIVLREAKQLTGEAAQIPPLPKNYDVEKKGRYSAGTFSYAKPGKASKKKQTAPLPTSIPKDIEPAEAVTSPAEDAATPQ